MRAGTAPHAGDSIARLNHVETGVTAVYDTYDQEKRTLDFWGWRRLEAILANKRDAKVLTFEARR